MNAACRFLPVMITFICLFTVSVATAEPPQSAVPRSMVTSLSLQGFTGILNTPNAHVQSEGSFAALFNNQKDQYPHQGVPSWQNNYIFSVGMFNIAEIGGRLTSPNNTRGETGSDLFANLKLSSAPLTARLPFSPAFAVGQQDLGSTGFGAHLFRTTYLAASADPFPWMRLSTGYGFGPDRMKGGFGGVEVKAHDWVYLLGEHDTRDTNAGIRLIAPPLPYIPASLTMTAKSALNRTGSIDLAFGLSLPLDFKSRSQESGVRSQESEVRSQESGVRSQESGVRSQESGVRSQESGVRSQESGVRSQESGVRSQESTQHSEVQSKIQNSEFKIGSLRERLISAGFANVRVGVLGETVLVVEYENVRYNHNELDAIGIVAGIASAADLEGIDSLWLVVKRKGLRMLRVSAPLKGMQNWLYGGPEAMAPPISVGDDTSPVEAARFIDGDSNPDWLRPSLILFPGLKTYVGTEVGVFDYLLSVKPDLQVTTWKGGVLNARWDLPLSWSENFNDGRQFESSRNKAVMDRLMLFQGISLAPGLMANLGGGMILHDSYGTLNELTWSPGSGMNRFRLAQAYARNSDNSSNTKVYLGSYRLYLSALDLFLEGTGGRFWGQDTGGLVTIKRFFGDVAVDLYYKNTETTEKKHWQAAGIQFSFPLTPRRDMKRAPLQVRGADEWFYAQETVLAVGGQKSNDTISASLGVNPLTSPDIYRSYLNRDRLNDDYIQAHKGRLKESWQTFRDSLNDAWPKF